MSAERTWHPFGVRDEEYPEPDSNGIRIANLVRRGPKADLSSRALGGAMAALGVLGAGAAVVSYWAQFVMVHDAKGSAWVAALEAGIPDVAALVFAALGIALALQGKRALRARALNVAAVGTSIGMNFLAAAGGSWRDVAIWVMPPVAYAVCSDTAIGVIRSWALARMRDQADDEDTPLAVAGALFLWLLRLALAPKSTLAGFRAWVVDEVRVAPGRTAPRPVSAPQTVAALPAAPTPGSAATATTPAKSPRRRGAGGRRGESKTARFLALVKDRHGELAGIDPAKVGRICAELAPEVGLDVGAARSALRPMVLAAQAGGAS